MASDSSNDSDNGKALERFYSKEYKRIGPKKFVCELENVLELPEKSFCNNEFGTKNVLSIHRFSVHNREEIPLLKRGVQSSFKKLVKAKEKQEALHQNNYTKYKNLKREKLLEKYRSEETNMLVVENLVTKDMINWSIAYEKNLEKNKHIRVEQMKRFQRREKRLAECEVAEARAWKKKRSQSKKKAEAKRKREALEADNMEVEEDKEEDEGEEECQDDEVDILETNENENEKTKEGIRAPNRLHDLRDDELDAALAPANVNVRRATVVAEIIENVVKDPTDAASKRRVIEVGTKSERKRQKPIEEQLVQTKQKGNVSDEIAAGELEQAHSGTPAPRKRRRASEGGSTPRRKTRSMRAGEEEPLKEDLENVELAMQAKEQPSSRRSKRLSKTTAADKETTIIIILDDDDDEECSA